MLIGKSFCEAFCCLVLNTKEKSVIEKKVIRKWGIRYLPNQVCKYEPVLAKMSFGHISLLLVNGQLIEQEI